MRVYGADFIKAFEMFEHARVCLDSGSVSQAGTAARRASLALKDASIANDRGRSPNEIITEIATIFEHNCRYDPMGGLLIEPTFIREVSTRLRCSETKAYALVKEWFEGPSREQLDAKAELPKGEELPELVEGTVEDE